MTNKRFGIRINAQTATDPLNGTMVELNPSGATYSDCEQWVREEAAMKQQEFGGGFYSFEVIPEA